MNATSAVCRALTLALSVKSHKLIFHEFISTMIIITADKFCIEFWALSLLALFFFCIWAGPAPTAGTKINSKPITNNFEAVIPCRFVRQCSCSPCRKIRQLLKLLDIYREVGDSTYWLAQFIARKMQLSGKAQGLPPHSFHILGHAFFQVL